MKDIIDIVLLLALPASGKSEVRRYLAHQSPETCRRDFHMGTTVQLDDFPYVHMMRRLDDELAAMGKPRVFFQAPDKPFANPFDWGTLIELINEDYADTVSKKKVNPPCAVVHLYGRIDAAAQKAGITPRFAALSEEIKKQLPAKLGKEARALLDEKQAGYPDTLDGKTVVIEFARGGADGSALPLKKPFGYGYSLSMLSDEILEKAKILYVWVTPEESRRKNSARANPDDPGSILHHGVPLEVMLKDYGTDDMDWLEKNSEKPGTITITARGKAYRLPVGRFDNRVDKTSFLRGEIKDWPQESVKAVHDGLRSALDKLI